MKKFYNEPEMNISLFSQENVVTASNETNGHDLASDELTKAGVSETNKVTLTWTW